VKTEGTEVSHLDRLRRSGELARHEAKRRRRGPHRQLPRRRLEAEVRRQGASFAREARRRGLTLAEAASRIGLNRRTLRGWQARAGQEAPRQRLLGRPLRRAAPARRNEVIAALAEAVTAPVVDVPPRHLLQRLGQARQAAQRRGRAVAPALLQAFGPHQEGHVVAEARRLAQVGLIVQLVRQLPRSAHRR